MLAGGFKPCSVVVLLTDLNPVPLRVPVSSVPGWVTEGLSKASHNEGPQTITAALSTKLLRNSSLVCLFACGCLSPLQYKQQITHWKKLILLLYFLSHCRLCLHFYFYPQLYELDSDPERKEFLDDLFIFMQKRGEWAFVELDRVKWGRGVLLLFEFFSPEFERTNPALELADQMEEQVVRLGIFALGDKERSRKELLCPVT